MSDTPVGPGSWQASDGKWYPAEQAPGAVPAPGPAGAAAASGLPGPLASWGERAIAYLIDMAILLGGFVVVILVSAIAGAVVDVLGVLLGLVGYLVVTAAGFYFFYMQGVTGASPGKKLTGLRVVGTQTGAPIGGGLGIVRYLAHFLDALICYIGFLLPLWDAKRQTIADKVMNTVVTTGHAKESFGPELLKV